MRFILPVIAFLANFSLINALSNIAYLGDPRVAWLGGWGNDAPCGNFSYLVGNGISLTFNGTSVDFVGGFRPTGGSLSFVLDSGTSESVDAYSVNIACSQILYRSPPLPYGTHKLTASIAGVSSGPSPPFMFFEYFVITVPDNAVVPPSSGAPTSSAESTSLASVGSRVTIAAPVPTGSGGSTSPAPINTPATVTAPVTAGIAVGAAVVSSGTIILAFLCFPFFLRKILSRDAVTGEVQSGLYRVINERYLNAAVPPNDNDKNPIAGISYGRLPEHRWDIIRQANGRYHIKNHGYTTLYVGWESIPAKAGDHVVNHRQDDRDWHITETPKDSRKYRISTKSNEEELFWTLPYEDRGTPIELAKSSKDTSQLWNLCLLEAHHDSKA